MTPGHDGAPADQASARPASSPINAEGELPKNKKGTVGKDVPFRCEEAFVVSGGKLAKPMAVECFRHEGLAYIKVSKREAWLCHACAGKARGTDPLARTRLIEDIVAALRTAKSDESRAGDAPADSMAGLGLDDYTVASSAPLPRRGRKGQPKVPLESVIATVPMRQQGGSVAQVRCLNKAPGGAKCTKSIYILCDQVPWLVAALAAEVARGGVDFEPPEATLRQPWWAPRERAWKCRAKSLEGSVVRKHVAVPTHIVSDRGVKRPMSDGEFKACKAAKLQDILSWRDQVESGFA